MKKILQILLVLTMFLGVVACGDKPPTTKDPNVGDNGNNVTPNMPDNGILVVETAIIPGIFGDPVLILVVKNTNKLTVAIEIECEYYDSEKKPLGADVDDVYALPAGKEAVLLFDLPENYASYEYFTKVTTDMDFIENFYDKVVLTENDTGEEIFIQVKNNSDKRIDYIYVYVIFYKDKKIIGVGRSGASNVESGRNGNITISYPTDSNWKDLEFDSYKIYLNEAFSFKE